MATETTASHSVIGQAALKMTRLPEELLPLVIDFLDYLERLHQAQRPAAPSADEIVAEAFRRSEMLRNVPREQLMTRFMDLGEEIRQEAIARGTAIEGDWIGD